MSADTLQRVFPLYVSPLELYFLTEDRPAFPMAFVIQMRLTGRLDRQALEAALPQALARHPLLHALVRPAKRGQPCWVESELLPIFNWDSAGQPLVLPADEERIDLSREVGLRVWVRQGEEQAEVTLQFHHACCDGIGAYRFIADWFALYGQRTAGDAPPPELEPIDIRLLRDRKLRVTELAYRNRVKDLRRRALGEVVQRFGWRQRPQPLAKPANILPPQPHDAFPAIYTFTFSSQEHELLRTTASQAGANMNDLLLAEMFGAIREWNERQGARANGRNFQIMMPTDLRDANDYAMPAANVVGYCFLARAPDLCLKPAVLLPGISAETMRIRQERLGLRFNDAIVAASGWRWVLPLLLRGQTCLATVVLSNVGDPSKRFTARFPRVGGKVVMGNVVLEEITGVPPMRPKTRATFSVFTYLRQLAISVRCDPHHFGFEHTRELAQIYIQRLRLASSHYTPR